VARLEVSQATLVVNGWLFLMMLVNDDPAINGPVKEDMIEWLDLILDTNK